MTDNDSINIVFSSDEKTFEINATMLHSIVRRTRHPVHAIGYCRNFLPDSFQTRNLTVDFIETKSEPGGKFPWWCNSCAFDRLYILRDNPAGWDRCWIMDYDNVATTDLSEVYFRDFNGSLVLASSYHTTLGNASSLPQELQKCAGYEFYMMGPILNLSLAQEAGTWERLLHCHTLIGGDEQKSLVAATENKLTVLDRRWQRVVYYGDLDADYERMFPDLVRPDRSYFEGYGLLHFTAGPKPWWDASVEAKPKKKQFVWFNEFTTWDRLRRGDWSSPVTHPRRLRGGAAMETNSTEPFDRAILAREPSSQAKPIPFVLVGIHSSWKHAAHRQEIRDTWLRVPFKYGRVVFFVGRPPEGESGLQEDDVVVLDTPDSDDQLPFKVREFFKHALKEDFDYLFTCSDDTYLRLDRVHDIIEGSADLTCSADWESRNCCNTGAGHLLSRPAVRALAECEISAGGSIDPVFTRAIRGLGLRVRSTEALRSGSEQLPDRGNAQVSAHGHLRGVMALVHSWFDHSKREIIKLKATHPHWRGALVLFANGMFLGGSANPHGRWTLSPDGSALNLSWTHWPADILRREGDKYSNGVLDLAGEIPGHWAAGCGNAESGA